MEMTIKEAMDYILEYDINGIVLTDAGRNAAIIILERREGWTNKHSAHLAMLRNGVSPMPQNLRRTVSRTRLGDAIELVRKLTRKLRKNQKSKARRKAAKARRAAAIAAKEKAAA